MPLGTPGYRGTRARDNTKKGTKGRNEHTLLFTSPCEPLFTSQIFKFSLSHMSGHVPPPHTPNPTGNPDEGTTAILHMENRRAAGEPFSRGELLDIVATTRAFLASANNKTGPGKKVLWQAVRSLLKEDSRALSKAWDKTQLSSVLLRWSQVALGLPSQDLQTQLTVRVLGDRKNPNSLRTRSIFWMKQQTLGKRFRSTHRRLSCRRKDPRSDPRQSCQSAPQERTPPH